MGIFSFVGRTFKAMWAFIATLLLGSVLGAWISIAVATRFCQTMGVGAAPSAPDAGWLSAIWATLTQPKLFIAGLLFCFVLVYVFLSFYYAWRRALHTMLGAHVEPFAQRIAGLITDRLSAMQGSQDKLAALRKSLSEKVVSEKATSLLGNTFWARHLSAFAVAHLPWAALIAEWEHQKALHAESEKDSLNIALSSQIAVALNEALTPSWLPAVIAMVLHAGLFLAGVWMGG
ncbi:MAG: hypothetical protein LBG61_02860 [Burkholderiales bacterium]|jgi:hypothetical protein|nr:hypothetical protein [Burkholderiales bacterium]